MYMLTKRGYYSFLLQIMNEFGACIGNDMPMKILEDIDSKEGLFGIWWSEYTLSSLFINRCSKVTGRAPGM